MGSQGPRHQEWLSTSATKVNRVMPDHSRDTQRTGMEWHLAFVLDVELSLARHSCLGNGVDLERVPVETAQLRASLASAAVRC